MSQTTSLSHSFRFMDSFTCTLRLMKRTYISARACIIVSSPRRRSRFLGSVRLSCIEVLLLILLALVPELPTFRNQSATWASAESSCLCFRNSLRISLLWRSHSSCNALTIVSRRPSPTKTLGDQKEFKKGNNK